VDYGFYLPTRGATAEPEALDTFVTRGEALGFTSVMIADHIVFPTRIDSKYPYTADGRFPGQGDALEQLALMAFIAARTRRLRLVSSVMILPYRNPVFTAKALATIDVLSQGRVTVGVGVGWLREEFDAVAVPFAKRGDRCREYLEVMRRLWEDEVSEHHGPMYDLPACRQYPKPVQRPHPPILFGGESDAALQRVADLGDGWYPFDLDATELADGIADLDKRLAANGRRREDVKVVVCPYRRPADLDLVRAYRDAGADEVVLVVGGRDVSSLHVAIDGLASSILEEARSL